MYYNIILFDSYVGQILAKTVLVSVGPATSMYIHEMLILNDLWSILICVLRTI